MTEITIVAPGPSLATLRIGHADIAINRAVEWVACDWLAAVDYFPPESQPAVGVICRRTAIAQWSARWPWSSVLDIERYFHGIYFSSEAAIYAAMMMAGCTRIQCIGFDLAGDTYADGSVMYPTNGDPLCFRQPTRDATVAARWKKERAALTIAADRARARDIEVVGLPW